LKGNDGLAGFSVKMNAGAKGYAPDPSKGDGQYILVMKGGIVHEGKLKKDLTVIWVGKNEGPFELVAGPDGLEGLILNFPVPGGGIPEEAKGVAADAGGEFKTWQCILCAFVYDEAAGFPEDGIAAGTRWADVPETFGCPDCSAKKADFEMIEF
jgi:rubredoxin